MLLYIHFPFCRAKCAYCGFYSLEFQDSLLQKYLGLLKQELSIISDELPRMKIETLYLGGGTPSLLQAAELEKMLEALHKAFDFSADLEFCLEGNPDSCQDFNYLRDLYSLGVNRFSLGVQSFRDKDLCLLGRRHSLYQALKAYRLLRKAGFVNLSLDLLWGLPGQTRQDWLQQLQKALVLGPEHISCYCLTLKSGTRLQEQIFKHELQLPGEEEQAGMFLQGIELLEKYNLIQYEISNFASPGHECRHNLGYWQAEDYLGLGPGAVSTLQGRRWKNPENLEDYADMVHSRVWPFNPGKLSRLVQAQELLMLRLRTRQGLELTDFKQRTGVDLYQQNSALLQALQEQELISMCNDQLQLSPAGMLLSDSILSSLALDWS